LTRRVEAPAQPDRCTIVLHHHRPPQPAPRRRHSDAAYPTHPLHRHSVRRHRIRRQAAAAGNAPVRARAATYTPIISGTGSTWSQNALDQWRKNVAANYGMTGQLFRHGSSAGRRDSIAAQSTPAVSEILFQTASEDEAWPRGVPPGFIPMPITVLKAEHRSCTTWKIGGKRSQQPAVPKRRNDNEDLHREDHQLE
jgi:hypothetical protein